MVNKYNLNINTCWKNLPWQKIYFRILIVQKKIFQATQKYNLKKLYKLQQYLLNSHEAKIFSIKTIFSKFNLYCNSYNKSRYNIQDKKKFIIFKSLYYLNNNKIKFYLIIEHIKQYIIFLCIEPQWKAKFMSYYYNDNEIYKDFFYINKFNYSKYIDKLPFNIKYICIEDLINRIQLFIYISNAIKYWLIYNFYINLANSFNLIYKNENFKIFFNSPINLNIKYFCQLIYKISLIGLDWYVFYLSENNFSYINKLTKNYVSNNKTKEYESLINIVKLNLYRKNILNKSKVNKFINDYFLLNKLNNIIKTYYINYIEDINLYNIKFLYKNLNFIIYFWYKNQNKNLVLEKNKLIKNNFYLNKFLHIKIIKYSYQKLIF